MNSADHSQFQFAAERYVLGELTEPETLVFEEHFFSCAACAQDVEDLTALRQAVPQVLPAIEQKLGSAPGQSRLSWFSLPWVPQFALGALGLLATVFGYQNVVQIPRLKAVAGQENLQLSPMPAMLGASRSSGKTSLSAGDRAVPLVIANEWPERYNRYEAKIAGSGSTEEVLHAQASVADGPLMVLVPAARLGPGAFELTVFGDRPGEEPRLVARYPITIRGTNEQ